MNRKTKYVKVNKSQLDRWQLWAFADGLFRNGFITLDEMRSVWNQHKEDILEKWIPAFPNIRLGAYWLFEQPEAAKRLTSIRPYSDAGEQRSLLLELGELTGSEIISTESPAYSLEKFYAIMGVD